MPSNPFVPKQIRFVNTNQPPSKRRRVNAACRTCRKRKTRCDGVKPECLTCTENGHKCLGYAEDHTSDDKRLGHSSEKSETHGEVHNGLWPTETNVPRELTSHKTVSGPAPQSRHRPRKNKDDVPKARGDHAEDINKDNTADHTQRSENHRVPYFRYFGPTAIVPGFKQMVVSVREPRGRQEESTNSVSRISGLVQNVRHLEGDIQFSMTTPFYKKGDTIPVNRLIINLVGTFFSHLGCNFPFLSREPFLLLVEECMAETILVNSVCALAARFSDHPLLTTDHGPSYPKSDYGHIFAQRAKAAVVDTFPCPTISAVQACLLLAYESFGANQDSALWMFLGCAIRMSVDLGLHKPDGIKHQAAEELVRYHTATEEASIVSNVSVPEKRNIEQACLNTLWSVFILDRLIASGTGRSASLKDADLEIKFPATAIKQDSGWPDPFPALIRIIHLHGRVSDLLNNIKNVQDVTIHKIEGLADMESDLTQLYEKLDPKLTFSAENFKYYTKAGDGTNFIMMHFWFHALIILLHQPTLMHSFEGQILQLFPNSRELSMSSAKTIADILAFAELIDPRSFIGNPFSSQPIYIAACAFLVESTSLSTSEPASRNVSPPPSNSAQSHHHISNIEKVCAEQKHSLLVAAANQNYQRCHNALKQSQVYWGGVRYILVALEQRAEGVLDPETFTKQEYESSKPINAILRNWARGSQLSPHPPMPFKNMERSSNATPSGVGPIGWSVTGTTNSPSSNLTFMYQNLKAETRHEEVPISGVSNMIYDPVRQSLPSATPVGHVPLPPMEINVRQGKKTPRVVPRPEVMHNSAHTLSGLPESHLGLSPGQLALLGHTSSRSEYLSENTMHSAASSRFFDGQNDMSSLASFNYGLGGYGDMMTMESQEVDMSSLGGEMMPWLDYLPHDVLQFFDNGHDSRVMPHTD